MTILIPKTFVHSFDLWGTIVDQMMLGEQKLEQYKNIAAEFDIDTTTQEKAIADYRGLITGEPWATGPRKGSIIDAIESILRKSNMPTDASKAVKEDAVYAMRGILANNDGVIIYTSKPADWVREALPEDISSKLGAIHHGDKSKSGAFKELYQKEQAEDRTVISHTADEISELIAARDTRLIVPTSLIYVARNDSNSRESVLNHGLQYTPDLTTVDYAAMQR